MLLRLFRLLDSDGVVCVLTLEAEADGSFAGVDDEAWFRPADVERLCSAISLLLSPCFVAGFAERFRVLPAWI